MSDSPFILRVALDVPLRKLFDYLPVAKVPRERHQVGSRVRVPFGRRYLVGLIVEIAEETSYDAAALKAADAILDDSPVLSRSILQLCLWSADYYQHALGEVCLQALPTALRQENYPEQEMVRVWRCSPNAVVESLPSRAKRQRELLILLQQTTEGVREPDLRQLGFSLEQLKKLLAANLVEVTSEQKESLAIAANTAAGETPLALNPEQETCLKALAEATHKHQGFLLYGVTGSGKTEVYLQWIQLLLQQGKQVLVLVPEIGLTPQTLTRFKRRFGNVVAAYHSGLSDLERWRTWDKARNGQAHIIIGTRSAVFLSFAALGAIVVDEEHDASFKQQDGFRYSARDLAMVRGKYDNVPVLLGSATPSLESLRNVEQGKYRMLQLNARAGGALPVHTELLDIKSHPLQAGLSAPLIEQMRKHLDRQEQVLVFINRRGYAPVLMCHDCGWLAECKHCDARMTLHKRAPHLRCHHCDSNDNLPARCPKCSSLALNPIGTGTERTEDTLQLLFPQHPIFRVDSDTARSKTRFQAALDKVQQGEPCILVGTQILAKGHHFPNVTLVAVVNSDSGLFSSDFRATERMVQTLIQVAGRSGRAQAQGRVIIQTHHADHSLLTSVASLDYLAIARQLLQEREQAQLPPYHALALLQCEAKNLGQAMHWLAHQREVAEHLIMVFGSVPVQISGPMPAIMERRADRYRAQLQLCSPSRSSLRLLLAHLLPGIDQQKWPRDLRWSIDVDPIDML